LCFCARAQVEAGLYTNRNAAYLADVIGENT